MPAWQQGALGGVKMVNVHPGNAQRSIPALSSTYMLFDSQTGEHLALIDGEQITVRRTVAASALAADFLAREDASSLLIVGAGRVANELAYAFRAIRPVSEVFVWDVNEDLAVRLVERLRSDGFISRLSGDLSSDLKAADIISCATLATEPVIKGEWLHPGQHVDLIGSFRPDMREADDNVMSRASVYIDTDGAFEETGDLIKPIQSGALKKSDVKGSLFDLCQGTIKGRQNSNEITVFKGVGTALEDLAAASLVHRVRFNA